MKKLFVLFAFCALLFPIQGFCQQPSREKLIGTWKHPIGTGYVSINNGDKIQNYNNEIFKFHADGTFVFGEYGHDQHALYEIEGYWALSKDKTKLIFTYDNGETGSIDIRDFNGNTFIITSKEGRDFIYTKE